MPKDGNGIFDGISSIKNAISSAMVALDFAGSQVFTHTVQLVAVVAGFLIKMALPYDDNAFPNVWQLLARRVAANRKTTPYLQQDYVASQGYNQPKQACPRTKSSLTAC